MPVHILQEAQPTPFDFVETATAHGWVALEPFEWHAQTRSLSRVYHLGGEGPLVCLTMNGGERSVRIRAEAESMLGSQELAQVRQSVRHMLRLDEDLSDFHRLHQKLPGWRLAVSPGGGRLLRAPTLFEDLVYTLSTTNITWSGTKRMVAALVAGLGTPWPGEPNRRAFPTPGQIAQAGEERLKAFGFGYRAGYVWELARSVAEGRLDLAALAAADRPVAEVRRDLLAIKGVGAYAAATLLMLLGRYDYLAIDSEMRSHVSRKYGQGEAVSDAQIRAVYEPWGRWRYLAYWFDPRG
jgi:3-methyladenine DNA glycosylase/8-oxoguanine DNA glycosylase